MKQQSWRGASPQRVWRVGGGACGGRSKRTRGRGAARRGGLRQALCWPAAAAPGAFQRIRSFAHYARVRIAWTRQRTVADVLRTLRIASLHASYLVAVKWMAHHSVSRNAVSGGKTLRKVHASRAE